MRSELPTAFVSCFDKDAGEDDRGSFWKKIADPKEISEIESRPTLLEGVLNRNRLDKDRESYFVLKQGVLFYRSDQSKKEIDGIAKLNFQKIEVFQSTSGTDKIYGIRLYSGNIQTKLLSVSREVVLEWYKKLGPMLINRDFFSKYELKDLLGEGAFSQVYKVVEKKTGQNFAAKVIKHKMIYSDKRGVLLMKQEIEIMRQLDHPNVIKLLEVHEVNNAIIMILEYANGSELKKLNITLSFQDVMIILKSLISVCSYLEGLGIIHRDLKPSNIMIANGDGSLKVTKHSTKIIDFGLAAYLSEKLILTKCGTPGYIAPEILNQSSRDKILVSQNVDVYSIGIIFYEMVFKCNPFKESVGKNDSKKVVRKNANNIIDFDKPTVYKQYLEARIIDLMKAMSSRDDKDRPYASALIGHPIVAKGSTLWRTSDYHPQLEENAVNHLSNNAYAFKVNPSIFSPPSSKKFSGSLSRLQRPPLLDLDAIGSGEIYLMEDISPEARGLMSPLNNRSKYKRRDFTQDEIEDMSPSRRRSDKLGSAFSLDKRFRGTYGKEQESPLLQPVDLDGSQVAHNTSRGSFRSSSVGKPRPKTHLSSTKKNTAYETETSYKGLFVLQKCENKEEKPSYYD